MRIFTRLLGVAFLLAAALALGADLAAAGPGGTLEIRPLGALWYGLHPGSLNLTQAVVERYIWEPLWDPVAITVLRWPAAPLFGVLGVLLLVLSFLRRPTPEDTAAGGKPVDGDSGGAPPS